MKETVLRELVRTAVPIDATIRGTHRGFAIDFRLAEEIRTLETARGGARMFASLDTAAMLVREIGLPRFHVDMSGYEPGRLRKARPDRAEALKQTRTRMRQQALEI